MIDGKTLCIEYECDVVGPRGDLHNPVKILLNGSAIDFYEVEFLNHSFGERYCYFSHCDDIVFTLPSKYANALSRSDDFFLACQISGWGDAVRSDRWKLGNLQLNGHTLVGLKIEKCLLRDPFPFKFISADGKWCSPDDDSPNVQISEASAVNFFFAPNVTGNNVICYSLKNTASLFDELDVIFADGVRIGASFSRWISSLYCDIPLGAIVSENSTTFSVFAPRATAARVAIFDKKTPSPAYYQMLPSDDGVWRTEISKNLIGNYYHYQFLSKDISDWDSAPKVLDPYARAAVTSNGPGIILRDDDFVADDDFRAPNCKDLVILEMHLRDVLANSPSTEPSNGKLNFSDLEQYLGRKDCYPRILGVNCVELQPIQEFDYSKKEDYHWGYMPANWFSPASTYAKCPEDASQVLELQKLVKAFHRAGMAVILDVVYNHFGDTGHLKNIDSAYYFRRNRDGSFTNFSGCGNDFRTESPMAAKLIVDSLEYIIKTYNIDGFRFDLAELLSANFLDFLQKRLKSVKKSIALMAEPWSFRGNIGTSMQKLPYSVWNDEYRDFVRSYVLANGNFNGLRYFLCGSLDFRSGFPGQSVNYVASHDDRGWVDNITENSHNDGSAPTENDCRRTRLAAAILMLSIGIPMIAEGQDFMASKHGVNNTYNRGDLNALDYGLIEKNRTTHEYFKQLIKFRLSECGDVLRLENVPSKTYFRFFPSQTTSACALMYNADGTFNRKKLLFAINPHFSEEAINFMDIDLVHCEMFADEDSFFPSPKKFCDKFSNNTLIMPPLSCRIYACDFAR
ncbi:MAG: hypothetical protein LBR91_03000 [Puniceicoccales bacterium]|nr:hypothetical protein [Puniceicoccales bacterium]